MSGRICLDLGTDEVFTRLLLEGKCEGDMGGVKVVSVRFLGRRGKFVDSGHNKKTEQK